jgi:hypothetical protein
VNKHTKKHTVYLPHYPCFVGGRIKRLRNEIYHAEHLQTIFLLYFSEVQKMSNKKKYTRCLKIREFRIQSLVGKDPVELAKYLEKKIALPEEDISTLILFNT